MNVLEVDNLGKAYRAYKSEWRRVASWFGLPPTEVEEHWVLKGVGFTIRKGESIGIVGRNGAGKSTLLKLITGTMRPTEGSVRLNGRVSAILELGMGFNPEFTGRQNSYHTLGLMGYDREQIARAMPEVEQFAEIGVYFDQPVRTYSSGMQARTAFAVATAFRPDILIVDEILSVGDAYFQAKCFERIAEYKKQQMTLLLVTHSTSDIIRHCDRAILLKNGCLFRDASPREISNLYLDDLFGKSKKNQSAQETSSCGDSEHTVSAMPTGDRDLFNSRPGYRREEHRWGQGGAVILDYAIIAAGERYPASIPTNTTTDFYFKVRFDRPFENIYPGFLLKTLDGTFVYGTNSFHTSEGRERIRASAGTIHVYRFSMPLSVNHGHYLVSFGISSGEGVETLIPLERRYDSVIITATNTMPFWGLVDLQATLKVHVEELSDA